MAEQPIVAALPPGSAPYYVVRFAPAAQRELLCASFALDAELARSVARSADPGVTRLKLDWWRRELAAATASAHPLVRGLAPLAATDTGLQAMHAMLDAAEAEVLRRRPDDSAGFHHHCRQSGALARLLLLADQTRDAGSQDVRLADALGQYASAVQRIQGLGQRLRADHNPLPRDSGLPDEPAEWHPERLAACCEQLLTPLLEAAEPALRQHRPSLAPARRWAAQARAVHRLLAREAYPVREHYVDTTPLARLWAAWRVR